MNIKLLLSFAILFFAYNLNAQNLILDQGFETIPSASNWLYTISGTGGSIQSGLTPSTGNPANTNKFKTGTQSFGTVNGTTILDFDPINTIYLKNIEINLKLASFSLTSANGADLSDLVEIYISTDGIDYFKEIEVKGAVLSSTNPNGNARWDFNATGIASRFFNGTGNFGIFQAPLSGNNLAGFATVSLTALPSVPNLYFRISLKNNATGELWLIDDLELKALPNNLPTIVTSKKTISNINYLLNSGPSAANTYNLLGINLSPAMGFLGVKAPLNFEISETETGIYSDSLSFAYASSTLNPVPVFTRLKSGLSLGTYGGVGFNVVHSGGGAISSNLKLEGKVNDGLSCGPFISIDSVRKTIPATNTYTSTATYNMKGKVTGVFGSNKFYLQDSTAGIAIFQSNIVSSNSLKTGDLVSLTAKAVRFNGEAEMTTVSCISKITSGAGLIPIVFDSNNPPNNQTLKQFLILNEGKLVKIKGLNINAFGTFVSGNNYNISACNSQGFMEIRVDAGAVSLIGTSIPSLSQDIIGNVGRFISATSATDKMQLFPRQSIDIENNTTPCVSEGGCGVSTYATADSTLEVMNWNLEWFGNPTLGPTQSGLNDATQLANAKTILNNANADIYMLQEICDYNNLNPNDTLTLFGKLLKSLNTNFGANTFSGECSSAYSYSYLPVPDPYGQRVCIIYKNAVVSKVFSRPMFENIILTSYPPSGDTISKFWASGRKPFQFKAAIDLMGKKDTVLFVGLHAKSGSAADDYARRKYDVKIMYDSLKIQYPLLKTMVLGDLNDDLDQSIAPGNISSFAPFLYTNENETNITGIRPSVYYTPISAVLSASGCASTTSFSDYIDHQILSNEFINSDSGLKYVNNSIASYRPIIANYNTTTSDHYPTISKFRYQTTPAPSPCSNLITLISPANDLINRLVNFKADNNAGKIIASNKISNESKINYFANTIELLPGFKADTGTVFKAQIGACN